MKKLKALFPALFLLLFFGSYESEAQVYTGGNVSYNFDNNGFYIDAAPILGYRKGRFRVGTSPIFSYANLRTSDGEYAYGARLFSELTLIKNVFAHAEIEVMNLERPAASELSDRIWNIAAPVGGGYRFPLGDKISAHGMILYDLLLDENSPRTNPIIRGGVTYNF